MAPNVPPSDLPTERQLALFRAVEDIHDLTAAIVVLLVDLDGDPVAASGDEDDIPAAMRAVISGKQLARAGSIPSLLREIGEVPGPPRNLSLFDVGHAHVLAILFDADADFMTVQTVGKEAGAMIGEILATL